MKMEVIMCGNKYRYLPYVIIALVFMLITSACTKQIEFESQDEDQKNTFIKVLDNSLVKSYYSEIRERNGFLQLYDLPNESCNDLVLDQELKYVSNSSYTFLTSDLYFLNRTELTEFNGLKYLHHGNDPWFIYFKDNVQNAVEIEYRDHGPEFSYNYSEPFVDVENEVFTACFGSFSLLANPFNRIFHFITPNETPEVYTLRDRLFEADIVNLKVFGRDANDLFLFGEYYNTIPKVKNDNRKIFAAKYNMERRELTKTVKFKSKDVAYEEHCFLHQVVASASEVVFVKEYLARTSVNLAEDTENDLSFFSAIKINGDLEQAWETDISFNTERVDPTELVRTKDNGFLIIGNLNRGLNNALGNFVVKLNNRGDVVFKKAFNNLETSWFISACDLGDGRIAVLGSSHEFADGYEQFIIMLNENGELE